MKAHFLGFLSGCVVLAGCVSLPKISTVNSVEVRDIIANIKCELANSKDLAIFADSDFDWTAGVNLSLETFTDAGIGADANLTVPLNPSTLVASIGGSYDGSAKSISVIEFQQSIRKPDLSICGPNINPKSTLLSGDLGINNWLISWQNLTGRSTIVKLSYTVEFVVEAKGNIGPKFTLIPIKSSLIDASANLSGSKKGTHTMVLTLTMDSPPAEPQRVVIVNPKKKLAATGKTKIKVRTIDQFNLQQNNNTVQSQSGSDSSK
jgi:hypothetical protein